MAENVIQEETTTKEVKEEEKVVSKPVSTEKYQSADIKNNTSKYNSCRSSKISI